MLDDLADRGDLGSSVEPVLRVDLADRVNGHLLYGEISTQRDQAVDIPRIESPLGWPGVVLLAHERSLPHPLLKAATRMRIRPRAAE